MEPKTDKKVQIQNKFYDMKAARISKDMFEFDKTRWRMGVLPYRLLMMISQSVCEQGENNLFPILEYSIDTIFKYLGLSEKDGRRYDKLADACAEFREKGLDLRIVKSNGAIRWVGISFITKYEFASDHPSVSFTVNDEARKFLVNLQQYAKMKPQFYLKLSTEYQNWFYPYLKMKCGKLPQWEEEIETLKYMLYLDKSPAYTTDQHANKNFFTRVLGIRKPKGKANDNQPWEFLTDSKGNFTGTLAGICANTDINVTAYPVMVKGKYTRIHFDLSKKSKCITKHELEEQYKNILATADNDMTRTSVYRKPAKKAPPKTIKDLFSSVPVMEMREDPTPENMPKRIIRKEELKKMVAPGQTINDVTANYIKLGKWRKLPNGDFEVI